MSEMEIMIISLLFLKWEASCSIYKRKLFVPLNIDIQIFANIELSNIFLTYLYAQLLIFENIELSKKIIYICRFIC